MLRSLSVLFLPLLFVGQNTKEDIKPYDDGEAYNVYSAVLEVEKSKGELLIDDTTIPFKHCLEPHSDKPVDAAIKNYKHTNQTRWRLQHKFNSKQNYRLVSSEEIERLQQPDPQGGFFWRFPEGVMIRHFSAVGFNRDKTLAFVETDLVCGGQCGRGQPYVLQRRDGKWQEYEGKAPKVVKRKKTSDGVYEVTMKSFVGYCGWAY